MIDIPLRYQLLVLKFGILSRGNMWIWISKSWA